MGKRLAVLMLVSLFVLLLVGCEVAPSTDGGVQFETVEAVLPTIVSAGTIGVEPTATPVAATDAVAILVLDSFQNNEAEGDKLSKRGDNCTVAPDGQGVYVGQGAGVYVGQGAGVYVGQGAGAGTHEAIALSGVTHGELVMAKFQQLLVIPPDDSADLAALAIRNVWEQQIVTYGLADKIMIWRNGDSPDLYLVAIDTDGYDTTVIVERLQRQMEALQNLYGITRFVVNMSFAIVPCDLKLDLEEYKTLIDNEPALAAFRDNLTALFGGNDEAVIAFMVGSMALDEFYANSSEQVYPLLTSDPLLVYLTDLPSDVIKVIAVAAAGQKPSVSWGENGLVLVGGTGNPFPYLPGLSQNVLSVSVQRAYSNAGEVMRQDGTVAFTGTVTTTTGITVTGTYTLLPATSWAAPEMSLAAADHLRAGGEAECAGLRPPLAYADPAVAGSWLNLWLPDAVLAHCSGDWHGPVAP